MLSYNLNYLHTKIPLSFFKIKKEIEKGDKICVHNIHSIAVLVYKSNGIINKSNKIIEIN